MAEQQSKIRQLQDKRKLPEQNISRSGSIPFITLIFKICKHSDRRNFSLHYQQNRKFPEECRNCISALRNRPKSVSGENFPVY
jgi:hypothetical protein